NIILAVTVALLIGAFGYILYLNNQNNDQGKVIIKKDNQIIALSKTNQNLNNQYGKLLQNLKGLDNQVIIPYVLHLDNALNYICEHLGGTGICTVNFNPATGATTSTP